MPSADISNSSLLTRMSVEGWIALFTVLVGGVISHVTLANDQEHTAEKVVANEKRLSEVQVSVQEIQTNIAIVKNEQRHMTQSIIKIQNQQTTELQNIRALLEQRQ